ncbi:hypothetical protein CHS0354_009381 [Potamilus streckersoni]|uniref:Uncharacterized protein n=1 Tax=Potamilus streckersoni TaxID=2493646 RepID=A0AAE0T4G1_9BIVA|nr:hypothetical protein CHS0354_009381 [Potamilus streckersoni]
MAAPMKHATPVGKIVFEKSNFNDKKSRHLQHITDHYFNYSVETMLPGCGILPLDIQMPLTEVEAFVSYMVPLAQIIRPDFLEGFVRRGKLHILSHGTQIDTQDCAALLPTGMLILNLTKDSYEQLGIEGKVANFGDRKTCKYVIEINVKDPTFVPGKKLYERIKRCLTEHLNLKFDFLLTWGPEDEKVSSASVQYYFQCNGFVCNRLPIRRKQREYVDLAVPVISSDNPTGEAECCCDSMEFYEWLGACATDVDLSATSLDSYTSSYTCPSPREQKDRCVTWVCRGMLTCDSIIDVLTKLRYGVVHKGHLQIIQQKKHFLSAFVNMWLTLPPPTGTDISI